GQALSGETCYANEECAPGTCCGIPSDEPFVSRREVPDLPPTPPEPLPPTLPPPSGTCKPLKKENATCNEMFDKWRGDCPCETGLTCFSFEVADGSTEITNPWVQTRPGYSRRNQCWTQDRIDTYQSPPDIVFAAKPFAG
ncbi:hypothetical protein BaRGS_00036992, partial [Batillaria attramentaria]